MSVRIAIVGAGPGGYIAAGRAARLGADVTLIEADHVGGTCLNRGCIPSKIMITTAELLEKINAAETFGIALEGTARPDMGRLMERKSKVLEAQRKGIHDLLARQNVRFLSGTGRIQAKGMLTVTGPDGQEQAVPWDKLILATGSTPFALPGMPFDGQNILSSDHALELQAVPASILIVGGGVIGCEFACLLSALGAKVTVVEALPRMLPLPSVDEDCSKILQREMKKRKIQFLVSRAVQGVDQTGDLLRVTIGPSPFLENPSEKDKRIATAEVEKILVCVGRKPSTASLAGLDEVGVKCDARGWVIADEYMRTSVPDVYAIGDLLGPAKIMLAHVASTEGLVAAENAMGAERKMDYRCVPGAIFTSPEVANVGLTETQAREQGVAVNADSVLFRTVGKAQVLGEIAGQAKIVSDAGTGRVLGVHIIGPHATELIAEGALAVQTGATLKDLAETIHAHPTLAEIMLETALTGLHRGPNE